MDHMGEVISTTTGILGIIALVFTWLKGGFKKQSDWDEAVKMVNKHEELSKIRGLAMENVTLRLKSLEESQLEMKRNYYDQFQQMMVKIDDTNKLLMELMFKIGQLTGKTDK